MGGLWRVLSAAIFFVAFSTAVFAATNPIIEAVATGDPIKVKEALAAYPNTNVDERDPFGGTALHGAMFKHNAEIVLLLLDHGWDVNAIGPANGYTPLHDAVWSNYLEGAKILVEKGADPTIKNQAGETAWEKASKEGKKEIAEFLQQVADKGSGGF
jgi:ankyrin repeat protein